MLTNFSLLTTEQKTVWSKDLWKQARNLSFVNKFLGKGPNSLIQHITELKKSRKGRTRCHHAAGRPDGRRRRRRPHAGRQRRGDETFDQVIRIDQLRHANRHEGRMADQKSVVEFRGNSPRRAGLLARRPYRPDGVPDPGRRVVRPSANNGVARVGSDLQFLEFAADVAAPSTNRRLRWDSTRQALVAVGATANVTAVDTPSWELFVALKAYAKRRYIRGVTEERQRGDLPRVPDPTGHGAS
jgi:hypothetical protein